MFNMAGEMVQYLDTSDQTVDLTTLYNLKKFKLRPLWRHLVDFRLNILHFLLDNILHTQSVKILNIIKKIHNLWKKSIKKNITTKEST